MLATSTSHLSMSAAQLGMRIRESQGLLQESWYPETLSQLADCLRPLCAKKASSIELLRENTQFIQANKSADGDVFISVTGVQGLILDKAFLSEATQPSKEAALIELLDYLDQLDWWRDLSNPDPIPEDSRREPEASASSARLQSLLNGV
jgi:hypothetical protein